MYASLMAANIRKRSKIKDLPKPRGIRERAGGRVFCLTAYLPSELGQAAKVQAAKQGRTLSALVTQALEEHLGAA